MNRNIRLSVLGACFASVALASGQVNWNETGNILGWTSFFLFLCIVSDALEGMEK